MSAHEPIFLIDFALESVSQIRLANKCPFF
ncbi:Uncharacterised protein [Vibrio cholerae]|nr:Uncharacterised protein [Vibrio cholerae]